MGEGWGGSEAGFISVSKMKNVGHNPQFKTHLRCFPKEGREQIEYIVLKKKIHWTVEAKVS